MESWFKETDLLIIGGGSAGCMAAIRALEINPELNITIFEKSDAKYSGSIARGMDALNIVSIPNLTTPELYVEAIQHSCQGVVDEKPSYVMAERSFELLNKLEKWGVHFIHDKDGNYRTLQYHVKGKFQAAMDEPDLKTMLYRKTIDGGVSVINRVMGIKLLMDDGRAAGAIGLNVRTGELVACKAKAVIITAGGQARFSLPNSGYLYGTFDYPGNSGDGYIMAYKSGAQLTGMEFTDRSLLIKDANMPLLAVTITRGGRVLDIFDKILMEGYCHSLGKMDDAFNMGHGPLRIQLSHLPDKTVEEIENILFTTERPAQQRFFKGRGINFKKHDIELWPTECQLCGGHGMAGVYVDEFARTTVPGLFAAGDVASVPKQHLSGAFVFGEVAAEQAAKFISKEKSVALDSDQILQAEKKRNSLLEKADKELTITEIEYKVRRFIGDYVISPKNEYKLTKWLHWSKIFKKELQQQVLLRNNHELSKAYEVENIICCADLSAYAALERKESRWGSSHFRSDFPEKDDTQWLKHILVQKDMEDNKVKVSHKSVQGLKLKENTPC